MRGSTLRGLPIGDDEDGMHPGVAEGLPFAARFTLIRATGIRGFPYFDLELALPFK
jgi:hypothetical protein